MSHHALVRGSIGLGYSVGMDARGALFLDDFDGFRYC